LEIISRKEAKKLELTYYFTGIPCSNGHVDQHRVANYSCLSCAKVQRANLSENIKENNRQRTKKRYHQNKDDPGWKKKQYESNKKHRENNKEHYKQANRNHYIDNKELHLEQCSLWYQDNKEKVLEYNKQYYSNNKDKFKHDKEYYQKNKIRILTCGKLQRIKHADRIKTTDLIWRRNNVLLLTASSNKRRVAKLQAIPKWLTEEDNQSILDLYKESHKFTMETGIPHVVDHYYPLRGKTVSGLHCPLNLQIITAKENGSKSNKHPDNYYDNSIKI
jgi:hypothetical protein